MPSSLQKVCHFFLFACSFTGLSQRANDCSNAVVVCGNSKISSETNGIGSKQELINNTDCLIKETNSLWLKINITKSGTLGFAIKPNNSNLNVDYDFAVFGPNASCNNLGKSIRCSTTNPLQSGSTSNITGLNNTETDTSEGPEEVGNNFLKNLNVNPGETYYIVVNRPDDTSGFSLSWTGTATENGNAFNDNPEINATSIGLCDHGDQGKRTIEHSLLNDLISSDLQNEKVSYYKNLSDANENINPLIQGDYTSQRFNIAVRVENKISGCSSIENLSLVVIPGAARNDETITLKSCDSDNDGITEFDLNRIKNITSTRPEDQNISFYSDKDDESTLLSNKYINTTKRGQAIYAKIVNKNEPICTLYKKFNLITVARVNLNSTNTSLAGCDYDNNGFGLFNLRRSIPFLTPTTNGNSYTFYLTENDANNQVNKIQNETTFTNTIKGTQQIFAHIKDDAECVAVKSIDLNLSPPPNISQNALEISSCGRDGSALFNLENTKNDISTDLNIKFTYHDTRLNATNKKNSLPKLFNSSYDNQPIFARVENNFGCFSIKDFSLNVIQLPDIKSVTLSKCDFDNDGFSKFDLSRFNDLAFNDNSQKNTTFHLTKEDANDMQNAINSKFTNSIPKSQVLYARVFYSVQNCSAIENLSIKSLSTPHIINPNPILIECDFDEDNSVIFNLERSKELISSTTSNTSETTTFYESKEDAQSHVNPINNLNAYKVNTSIKNKVYSKFELNTCNVIVPIELRSRSNFVIPKDFQTLYQKCDNLNDDNNDKNGIGILDISNNKDKIIKFLPSGNYSVSYHQYLLSAELNSNPISNISSYKNILPEEVIYNRIEIKDEYNCLALGPYTKVRINPLPYITLEVENNILCVNKETENKKALGINLGEAYSYLWNTGEKTPIIEAKKSNDYFVRITNKKTNCTATSNTITLTESYLPEVLEIKQSPLFSDNFFIEINTQSIRNLDFRYAIDNLPFQKSNVFNNLSPGNHILKIKDIKGCGTLIKTINFIGFQKFMTPNGDGRNDTWKILGFKKYPYIKLYDRFGSYLGHLDKYNKEWDGNFNGQPLPSGDYWVSIFYLDSKDKKQKIYRNHFTLKR